LLRVADKNKNPHNTTKSKKKKYPTKKQTNKTNKQTNKQPKMVSTLVHIVLVVSAITVTCCYGYNCNSGCNFDTSIDSSYTCNGIDDIVYPNECIVICQVKVFFFFCFVLFCFVLFFFVVVATVLTYHDIFLQIFCYFFIPFLHFFPIFFFYKQGINIATCSKNNKGTNRNSIESSLPSTFGFVSKEIMNQFQNEGYMFVQKVDDDTIDFHDDSSTEVEKENTGMITTRTPLNNTHSQWVRVTSDGYEYYKSGLTTATATMTNSEQDLLNGKYQSNNNTTMITTATRNLIVSTKDHYRGCADTDSCTRLFFLPGVQVYSKEVAGCNELCTTRCVGFAGYLYYKSRGYYCGKC
jgi:hypothetical protein